MTAKMEELGYDRICWLFSEAGHGKGPVDGVGAALKRAADQCVAHGQDIATAKAMYDKLESTSKIKLYYVSRDQINYVDEQIPLKVVGVPGTMRVHQLITVSNSSKIGLFYRNLACHCSWPQICQCYEPKEHFFTKTVLPDSRAMSESRDIIEVFTEQQIDEWCLVEYQNQPYPGQIVDVDEEEDEIQVKVMKCVGLNRYTWPNKTDQCWYKRSQFIAVIAEPTKVTRHYKLSDPDWVIVNT